MEVARAASDDSGCSNNAHSRNCSRKIVLLLISSGLIPLKRNRAEDAPALLILGDGCRPLAKYDLNLEGEERPVPYCTEVEVTLELEPIVGNDTNEVRRESLSG